MTLKKALKPARKAAVAGGFTDEERLAMKARAEEVKAEKLRGPSAKAADGEADLLASIAKMPEGDRALAERVHGVVMGSTPVLFPRTWYGMPAYAKDGNVVCFFQASSKFKTRYSTFGFSDKAKLDEGNAWPVAFALKELTAEVELRIAELVKRAVG